MFIVNEQEEIMNSKRCLQVLISCLNLTGQMFS